MLVKRKEMSPELRLSESIELKEVLNKISKKAIHQYPELVGITLSGGFAFSAPGTNKKNQNKLVDVDFNIIFQEKVERERSEEISAFIKSELKNHNFFSESYNNQLNPQHLKIELDKLEILKDERKPKQQKHLEFREKELVGKYRDLFLRPFFGDHVKYQSVKDKSIHFLFESPLTEDVLNSISRFEETYSNTAKRKWQRAEVMDEEWMQYYDKLRQKRKPIVKQIQERMEKLRKRRR